MDRIIVGPEMLQEMEQQVAKIKQNLKATQDRKNNYAGKDRVHREFQVGDKQ